MEYCKYGHHFTDWVPTPFGTGNCAMPGFECTYEGNIEVPELCEEDDKCPAYEPSPSNNLYDGDTSTTNDNYPLELGSE